MKPVNAPARRRWATASRTIAGTLGAYALASLVTVALSLLLDRMGMTRVEAVIAATLASFTIFAFVALAAFQARTATRAWLCLLLIALPSALAVLLLLSGARS